MMPPAFWWRPCRLAPARGVSSEVEHSAFNRLVVGSIPTRPTTFSPDRALTRAPSMASGVKKHTDRNRGDICF